MRASGRFQTSISLISLCTLGITGCGGGEVTDLGTLGGTASYGHDINEANHAIGYAFTADSKRQAFLYDGDDLANLGPTDAFFSEAYGINDNGQVVGRVRHEGASPILAFLYDPSEGMQDLGTLGGDSSLALGVNNFTQVVGWSDLAGDDDDEDACMIDQPHCGTTHAFLWENGTMTDLGTLGGSSSEAWAINNAGQIAGWASTEAGTMHAALWDDGTIIDLGVPGRAYDINESGEVVGTFYTEGQAHAFLYRDGELIDLGAPSPYVTEAYGINNNTQVVGYYLADDFSSYRAFLWEDGVFVDLDALISPLSGWKLIQAWDINDGGQIVGTGWRFDGMPHAFILTLPSDE